MIDKNKIPKDLFGTESEVTIRLSREFKLTISESKIVLDYLVKIGAVLKERSLGYPGVPSVSVYSYNKNFDWDDFENSQYLKYRYVVIGTYQKDELGGICRFNVIVEWNRRDLSDLIKEIKKSLGNNVTECDIYISNIIEIGYPQDKDDE